jgi:deferrochelatase/peroxidase EfeB
VNLHLMIRRGTNYGPPLRSGVMDDDGAERGIVFVVIGAHLGRQFEFIKSQWLNEGNFTGLDREKDLLVVERFVITRGGEYCFLPSLSALPWLAAPK